jgi:hypothetical protein
MDDASLPQVFDRLFRDAVRQDARAAYGLAADRIYSPSDGWGPLMFGLAIYFNLDQRFQARYLDGSPLRYVTSNQGPELRSADVRTRWKKTGSRLGAPGEVSRPSDVLIELAALNMAVQPGLLDQPESTNWVIAHSGNPADGLLTVHLAAPRLAGNGRIVGWHESVAIFDARRPHLDLPDIEAPGLPEPIDLPDLEIGFRPDAPQVIDETADGEAASGGE